MPRRTILTAALAIGMVGSGGAATLALTGKFATPHHKSASAAQYGQESCDVATTQNRAIEKAKIKRDRRVERTRPGTARSHRKQERRLHKNNLAAENGCRSLNGA